MRSFRRITAFILSTVIIAALFFYFLTVRGYSYVYGAAQSLLTEKTAADGDFREFSAAKGSLNRSMIFMLCCEPETEGDFTFAFELFSYLDSETGIKYIADNIGYAAGRMINEYLKSGDEELLDGVFEAAKDKALYSERRKAYYRRLYECSTVKLGNNVMSFFGLTAEESGGEHTAAYIKFLLGKNSERSVSPKIRRAVLSDMSDRDAYLTALRESVYEYESLYKELFTEDFYSFSCALDNYFYDGENPDEARKAETVNLNRIYEKNIRGKYFITLPDISFMQSVYLINDALEDRVTVWNLYLRPWFGGGNEIYSVNGGILGYFQRYGGFVARINGRSDSPEYIGEKLYFIRDTDEKEE